MWSIHATTLFITTFLTSLSQHVRAQGGTGVSRFEQGALVDDKEYDTGALGAFPNVTYRTSDNFCPLWNKHKFDRKCSANDNDAIFLSLYGSAVERPSLVIVDQQGRMLWQHFPDEQPAHFKPVKYNGTDHLVYWAGESVNGVTMGSYHLLNSSYVEVHNIHAANNLEADIHAFSITPNDTALFTVYERRPFDLSPWNGPQNGWIWDSGFQEVGIATGELLFHWRAADHLSLEDVESRMLTSGEGTEERPLDWIHVNSVSKSAQGNYIVSARYHNAVASISGADGKILWQLGGAANTLTLNTTLWTTRDNSTPFTLHHTRDASLNHDGTVLHVFDNYETPTSPLPLVRGLRFSLSLPHHASLDAVYTNPLHTIADRGGGSLQPLPNGNALMSYGGAPLFAEFARDGTLLCDTHVAPLLASDRPAALSHRIHKGPWAGTPLTSPSIKLVERSMYISWNGATTVQFYSIEGRDRPASPPAADDGKWEPIGLFARGGFETAIHIAERPYRIYRVRPFRSMLPSSALGTWVFSAEGVAEASDLRKFRGYELGHRAGRNLGWVVAGVGVLGALGVIIMVRPWGRGSGAELESGVGGKVD